MIDSARFKASLLSGIVDNLVEVIYQLNAKIVINFLNAKVSRTIQ